MDMRDILNLITEAASEEDGWKRIEGPIRDVTGDYCTDIPNHYDAHELVEKYPAAPELGDLSRDVLVYMNANKSTKIVMSPIWDGGNGDHYVITVYQRA